ncbi:hypothetical protein BKA63DRAFT_552984 [Paraphoma chrysanthemicola]|nr:hypothetical protein BKA63DRAFT_552984 [Paraphoma chrysanthemicola]
MHIHTLLASLLATTALAAPNPRANPQYNQLAPAAQSTAWVTSVVWITTTEWRYPSSTSSSQAASSTSLVFLPPSPSPSPSTTQKLSSSSTLVSVPLASASTEPRVLGGVYICPDINWSGSCTHYLRPLGSGPNDCVKLNGDATSVGPDEGIQCTFFT